MGLDLFFSSKVGIRQRFWKYIARNDRQQSFNSTRQRDIETWRTYCEHWCRKHLRRRMMGGQDRFSSIVLIVSSSLFDPTNRLHGFSSFYCFCSELLPVDTDRCSVGREGCPTVEMSAVQIPAPSVHMPKCPRARLLPMGLAAHCMAAVAHWCMSVCMDGWMRGKLLWGAMTMLESAIYRKSSPFTITPPSNWSFSLARPLPSTRPLTIWTCRTVTVQVLMVTHRRMWHKAPGNLCHCFPHWTWIGSTACENERWRQWAARRSDMSHRWWWRWEVLQNRRAAF